MRGSRQSPSGREWRGLLDIVIQDTEVEAG